MTYLDEYAAFRKGAGIELLNGLKTKYPEIFGLAELSYDEKTDTYLKNDKLCRYYARYFDVIMIPAEQSIWNCETPVFCTKGCENKAKKAFFKTFGNS